MYVPSAFMLDFNSLLHLKRTESSAESLSQVKKRLRRVIYIFPSPSIERFFSDLTSFQEVVWKLTLEMSQQFLYQDDNDND